MRIKGTQRLQTPDDDGTISGQKAANPGTPNPFREFQWERSIINAISKDCVTFFTPNNATGLKHCGRQVPKAVRSLFAEVELTILEVGVGWVGMGLGKPAQVTRILHQLPALPAGGRS